jgi:hypothetical protein
MIKIGALPFDTPKNIPRSLQFTYKSSRGFVNEISPKNFPPFFSCSQGYRQREGVLAEALKPSREEKIGMDGGEQKHDPRNEKGLLRPAGKVGQRSRESLYLQSHSNPPI